MTKEEIQKNGEHWYNKYKEVKYQTEDSKKWQNMYKQRCEECRKLEQENAELKEHHKSVCEILTNTHRSIREQLTKATELLKEAQGYIEHIDDILYDEIEQFIKEIEK